MIDVPWLSSTADTVVSLAAFFGAVAALIGLWAKFSRRARAWREEFDAAKWNILGRDTHVDPMTGRPVPATPGIGKRLFDIEAMTEKLAALAEASVARISAVENNQAVLVQMQENLAAVQKGQLESFAEHHDLFRNDDALRDEVVTLQTALVAMWERCSRCMGGNAGDNQQVIDRMRTPPPKMRKGRRRNTFDDDGGEES